MIVYNCFNEFTGRNETNRQHISKYHVPFNPFILEQIHIIGVAAFPAAIIQFFY